jgi:signal transduction histidine kinase
MGSGTTIQPSTAAELRRTAEKQMRTHATVEDPQRTETDMLKLVQELEIHQIELELQNVELLQARGDLETVLEKYIGLFDFAPVGYFTLDRNSAISAINLCGAKLLGHDRSYLAGRHFGQFIKSADRPLFSAFITRVFSDSGHETCEVELQNNSATPLFVQIQAKAAVSGQVCIIAVIDITALKGIAAELKNKNAEIERFIYSLSHDLRTPLVTVKTFLGYLEIDMTAGNHERIAKDLHFIHGAAEKMELMLTELLEYARIDRIETPPSKVSLIEVLAEVMADLGGVISERNVDIHLSDTDLTFFGDRLRLCSIWQNLIDNAIKYSRDNTVPKIIIGVRQVNGETVFSVTDYGIGVDQQHHIKIFEVFEKLDIKSTGAGLGLSIVRKIIERYGGRIWIESEGIDKGSSFLFTLPDALVPDGTAPSVNSGGMR